jgi:peptidoglycan hydrolase-like protein with peptidoglycan-binding domain
MLLAKQPATEPLVPMKNVFGAPTQMMTALQVVGAPDAIYLQWNNPTNADFVRTIIVRKEGSAPTNRTDGTTVYEGTATRHTDTTAVSGRTYFYALFSFDTSLNYSASVGGSTRVGALSEAQAQAQLSPNSGGATSNNTPNTSPVCTPTGGSGGGVTITVGLVRGSKNNSVLLLQRYLNANGFVIASSGPGSPGNESDYYGALTEAAVKRFQCARGITCSGSGYGTVGPRTRAELAKGGAGGGSCTVPTTPTTPVTPPTSGSVKLSITRPLYLNVSGEDVRSLQRFLNANGFVIASSGPGSPGNESTFFGVKTEDAVKKYQCSRGIICSGYGYGAVGPQTRARLNAE